MPGLSRDGTFPDHILFPNSRMISEGLVKFLVIFETSSLKFLTQIDNVVASWLKEILLKDFLITFQNFYGFKKIPFNNFPIIFISILNHAS